MGFSQIDLVNFRVVIPASTSSVSYAELRIAKQKLHFNYLSASELGYPEHVCMLVSDDGTQLVVGGSKKTQFTLPFQQHDAASTSKEYSKKAIGVGHTAFVKAIRKKMGWLASETYRVRGVRIPDSPYLLFDFSRAECGKRQRGKISEDTFLEHCPSLNDIEKSFRNIPALPMPM